MEMRMRSVNAVASFLAGALFLMLVAASAHVRAIGLDEIVRRTRANYASTKSAEISFEQTGSNGTTSGLLQFAENRYRLELPKQTVVSNGTFVWTYTPTRNQVVISKASTRSGALTPGDILTKFPGTYSTALEGERTLDGRRVWLVRCRAGKEKIGDVTEALLYIDQSTFRFSRIDLQSASMGATTIRVKAAKYNVELSDSRFNFKPPVGTRVVNLAR